MALVERGANRRGFMAPMPNDGAESQCLPSVPHASANHVESCRSVNVRNSDAERVEDHNVRFDLVAEGVCCLSSVLL